MRALWQWLLDCLEALNEDDRNLNQRILDHRDAQKRWYEYLGSGK